MAKVAFIGLGVMGFPMAGHLKVKGGHEVTVIDRQSGPALETSLILRLMALAMEFPLRL